MRGPRSAWLLPLMAGAYLTGRLIGYAATQADRALTRVRR